MACSPYAKAMRTGVNPFRHVIRHVNIYKQNHMRGCIHIVSIGDSSHLSRVLSMHIKFGLYYGDFEFKQYVLTDSSS